MPTVLILDCNSTRAKRIAGLLDKCAPNLKIQCFTEARSVLSWLSRQTADLFIADSQSPGLGITEFIRQIRVLPNGQDIALLMLTPWDNPDGRYKILEAGATDLLTTPIDDLECRARCGNLLAHRSQQQNIHERTRWLEQKVSDVTSEIRLREHETLLRLAKAGEYRDQDTGNHIVRMAKYSRLIAEQLGLPESECETIELAAPMHDIGKIGIPDEILLKPGRLTYPEYNIMKTHTLIGYEILKESPSRYLQMGAVIALNHHERFNGTGYPNRLARHDIPLPARIVAVADTYDALTSERPYKGKWSIEDSVNYLDEHRGNHFCPEILDAFKAQLHKIKRIQLKLDDETCNPVHTSISA